MAIIRTSITVCPICQSENLVPWAGGISGEMLCKDCGYHGSFVIEKSVDGGEDKISGLGQKKDETEENPAKPKPSKARLGPAKHLVSLGKITKTKGKHK